MIEKTLNRDKERAIAKALRSLKMDAYLTDVDFDKGEAYFDKWSEDEGYSDYMVKFTMADDNLFATITSEPVRVTTQTEYVTISKSQEDSIANKILKGISSAFGGTARESEPVEQSVVLKQFDEDQMIEIAKMYISPEEIDAHDDSMTAEEIVKMVDNFNSANEAGVIKGNIDHKTDTEQFSFAKAWVSECDCTIGGHFVPEGTPLLKIKYNDKELWEERKTGGYTGWSIGAKAKGFEYVEVE